ncbi:hypothetical protein RBB79_20310 [Tunturiibacter empetritectus]|uniref:Uncharacterized protein n=1 Tax=Tunturiibacter lichenicola TaxID=2051959 RepID=A0A852VGT4_9BACT|nr:hypothetical protein [Edaphobacter lichenicola]NYF92023.1 hypothetical protein [Edaphobacter lichenicola]
MHRLSATLFLLAATASLAQSSTASGSKPDASAVILRSIPGGTDCPIGFRANRQSTAQVLSANNADKNGPVLGLHITLDQPPIAAIESIEVTVYGVSPKGRIVPTDFRSTEANTRDTVSKSFLLERSADDKTLSNADVWMNRVGALRWVDLNEIRYNDGTIWRPSGSEKCRAVPSNVVLVSAKSR